MLFSGASCFIKNAQLNDAVGLVRALRMLLVVQQALEVQFAQCVYKTAKVTIRLEKLSDWAREAKSDEFLQATLRLQQEGFGDGTVFLAQILRPHDISDSVSRGSRNVQVAWFVGIFILCLLVLLSLVGVLVHGCDSADLHSLKKKLTQLQGSLGALAVSFSGISGAAALPLGLCCLCWVCNRKKVRLPSEVADLKTNSKEPLLKQNSGYEPLRQQDDSLV